MLGWFSITSATRLSIRAENFWRIVEVPILCHHQHARGLSQASRYSLAII